MQIFLEAIKLNHDQSSATGDAFNIRRNDTEPVYIPEWRRGISVKPEDSPAAYAIRETRKHILTIKAQFSSTDISNAKVLVRAVAVRLRRRRLRSGPIGSLLRAFSLVRPQLSPNILGEVKERPIEFNAAGETGFETFELQDVRLQRAGVSVSNTEWRWQFRVESGDRWIDFALTKHRIYTVLEIPKCPWQQTPIDDDSKTQLPWADALEYACDWAAGAQDLDQAATLVTRSINDLGLGNVHYSPSSLYSCPNFNCTEFLDLLQGGTGMGTGMNCSDCATVVSSFANLLGCDLRQVQLGPAEILTNLIREIGSTTEFRTEFFGHEVAWNGGATEDGNLFDACLQVDGDEHPDTPPFAALLPANIPLGTASEKHYRFRLSAGLVLRPDTLTCRKIGYSVTGDCRPLDKASLEFLKRRYDYDSWSNASWSTNIASAARPLSVNHFLQKGLAQWRLKLPVQQPKFAGPVKAFQTLWFPQGDQQVLLRLDVFELPSAQAAREFLLHELGEFHQLRVHRLLDPSIGDVSFAEAGDLSIVFARAEFVFMVRSVGRKAIAVRQIATAINQTLS